MNEARWRRIEDVCQAALAADAGERAALIEDLCRGDDDLRREVESLLSGLPRSDGFLQEPVWQDAPAAFVSEAAPALRADGARSSDAPPALAPGADVGPFRITHLIDRGGMGEVYLAVDTRLDREVAIKLLPPDLATDPGAQARFAREARVISNLHHPNICTMYDVGVHEQSLFLVMEHLPGETLATRLARGPLPLKDVLEIGAQIADALAAAHARGIIHRDLKPANVMLAPGGAEGTCVAKLLDFGLAKLTGRGDRPVVDGDTGTSTSSVSAAGAWAVAGTLPYMAPEQLEGSLLDPRTDLWALGTILFEMATARRVFEGRSPVSLVGRIMSDDPPALAQLPPDAPPVMQEVIRRCLAKEPDQRWASAGEVASALREIRVGPAYSLTRSSWTSRLGHIPAQRLAQVATGAVVLAAAAIAAWLWMSERQPSPAPPQHRQVTFTGDVTDASISPDGRWAAYAVSTPDGSRRVFVQELTTGEPVSIWEGSWVHQLHWTPDGSAVLMSVSRRQPTEDYAIVRVPRTGGEAYRFPPRFKAGIFSMSPDGLRLAGAWAPERAVRILTENSEESRRIALQDYEFIDHIGWNGDGRELFVSGRTTDGRYRIRGVDLGAGMQRIVFEGREWRPALCPPATGDALYAQRNSGSTTQLVRVPLNGQAPSVLLTGLPPGEAGACSVSDDATRLLLLRTAQRASLWHIPIEDAAAIPARLTRGTMFLTEPAVSADGAWVAATRVVADGRELVRLPASGGDVERMSPGSAGRWSPDGRRFAYLIEGEVASEVWVGDASGSQATRVAVVDVGTRDLRWLPDGRLAWQTADVRNYRIRHLETGREEWLMPVPPRGFVLDVVFAPSGAFALYWNVRQDGIWVFPRPGAGGRLVALGDLMPVGWSANETRIFAIDQDADQLVALDVRTGQRDTVYWPPSGRIDSCALTPDGFAAVCAIDESSTDAWLIENFDPAVTPPRR